MISVGLVIMAFNITVYEDESKTYEVLDESPHIFDDVIKTPRFEKKKLPAPNLEPSEKFIDDENEFIEDPLPEPIDPKLTIDTQFVKPALPKFMKERPKPAKIVPVEKVNEVEEMDFVRVEEMPRFPGCEDVVMTKEEKQACSNSALLKYIYSNIKYPPIAVEMGIEGTVVAQFVIDENGQITKLKIVKEIGGSCGNEVLRIVSKMPDWIPGKQRGRKVRVRYMLPVKFDLE